MRHLFIRLHFPVPNFPVTILIAAFHSKQSREEIRQEYLGQENEEMKRPGGV